jgi:hypothetical protein
MCPGVASDRPGKCPVCNMGLIRRRRGEPVPGSDGGLARMQLSPYRVQLAGIQTAAVEYRPLDCAVTTGGLVEAPSPPGLPLVRVQAEVYEKDLALLAEGQRVEAWADGFPGRTPFTGRVRGIVSPPGVVAEIDNPRSELRPGMFVTVRVKVPAARLGWLTRALADDWAERSAAELAGRALAAPAGAPPPAGTRALLEAAGRLALRERGLALTVLDSAVIDTGSRKVVYVEAGPGMFDAVEIVVGPRCGDLRPVLQGLEAGQRVAAAGAFVLDAETRLNPAVAAAYFGAARGPAPVTPAGQDVARALARLPAAERARAARQKICPVTGEPLGSMGVPVRVDVAGRAVFLCCPGCEATLRQEPDKYIPRLPRE